MTDILERLKLELNDDEPKSFVEIDSQLVRDLASEIRQLRLALNHQIEMRRQITGPLREEIAALRSRVGELEAVAKYNDMLCEKCNAVHAIPIRPGWRCGECGHKRELINPGTEE